MGPPASLAGSVCQAAPLLTLRGLYRGLSTKLSTEFVQKLHLLSGHVTRTRNAQPLRPFYRRFCLVAGVCLSVNADSCGSEMTQKVNDKPTCSRCLIFKHRVETRMGYGFEPLLPRTSTHLSTKIVDAARCWFL